MNKYSAFSKDLTSWYRKNARDLPWRRTKDPYKIWISEIMLQQTTVNAVIPYYEKWSKAFPTVYDVAKTSLQKILKAWQGLGYYTRARNIHRSAQLICDSHGGKIPNTVDELRKLPGFGPYTVGAVSSIAFDKRVPIIDANVRRVFMRLLAIEGHADTSNDKEILKFLDKVMPQEGNNIFNQALMELGALVCRNREPVCLLCPVKKFCKAYKQGIQELIPEVKKKDLKDIEAVIAILRRGDKVFIQKRPSSGLLADLWEFPGGKIEKGETPSQALNREIKEELDIHVTAAQHLFNLRHFYTQFRVNLHVFTCEVASHPKVGKGHKWVGLRNLAKYPMPSGSAKIVEKIS